MLGYIAQNNHLQTIMGKVFSVIHRKINRFNVENRAQKVIAKSKPVPAPKHPATLQEFERIKRELSSHPGALSKRDAVLHDKLKDVYVFSTDPEVEKQGSGSSRPLPQERRSFEVTKFGFLEPTVIPEGRCTLQQALKFISDYQEDPVRWKQEVIAKEYKLHPATVEKILQHYRMFQVYIPTDKDKKKEPIFVLPLRNEKQLAEDTEVKQTKLKNAPIEDK